MQFPPWAENLTNFWFGISNSLWNYLSFDTSFTILRLFWNLSIFFLKTCAFSHRKCLPTAKFSSDHFVICNFCVEPEVKWILVLVLLIVYEIVFLLIPLSPFYDFLIQNDNKVKSLFFPHWNVCIKLLSFYALIFAFFTILRPIISIIAKYIMPVTIIMLLSWLIQHH